MSSPSNGSRQGRTETPGIGVVEEKEEAAKEVESNPTLSLSLFVASVTQLPRPMESSGVMVFSWASIRVESRLTCSEELVVVESGVALTRVWIASVSLEERRELVGVTVLCLELLVRVSVGSRMLWSALRNVRS